MISSRINIGLIVNCEAMQGDMTRVLGKESRRQATLFYHPLIEHGASYKVRLSYALLLMKMIKVFISQGILVYPENLDTLLYVCTPAAS